MSSTALVSRRLQKLEGVIERGLASFVAVGDALMQIRDGELYLDAGFDGFEDYCRARWGFSRQYAYTVIAEARVNQLVDSPILQSQARELAPLITKATPDVVQQVYAEVVEETDGKPTAARIREKVQKILPPKKRPAAAAAVFVDLRPEGLADTVSAISRLVSVLGLVRGNENTPADQLQTVIQELEWIADEVGETLLILKEGKQ